MTDSMKAWVAEHAPSVVSPGIETEQFLDYFRARGEARKDWAASWRHWMRNAEKFALRDGVGRTPAQAATPPETPWFNPNAEDPRTAYNRMLAEVAAEDADFEAREQAAKGGDDER